MIALLHEIGCHSSCPVPGKQSIYRLSTLIIVVSMFFAFSNCNVKVDEKEQHVLESIKYVQTNLGQ